MGWFGKSFDEKVQEAVEALGRMNLGVQGLRAHAEGKVVTLEGEAPTREVKSNVIVEFNKLVDTENTINKIRVTEPAPSPPAEAPAQAESEAAPVPQKAAVAEARPPEAAGEGEERVYVVQPGDTLSAIAKHYYGKASQYMKIFEANRDVLDNPDLIKVGQRLRIPE